MEHGLAGHPRNARPRNTHPHNLTKGRLEDRSPAVKVPGAEIVNAVSHGVGLALSIVGATILIAGAQLQGDAYRLAGCTIFAATLIAVYAASTLSHIPFSPRPRHLFRSLDQGFIYLLIVGTGTPFALTYLRTGWWFLFYGVMWTLALCGFVSKALFSHRVERVATWAYLLLGWVSIATLPSLARAAPVAVWLGVLLGGLFYTCGTLFLARDDKHRYYHAIWHLFVGAGSACHFLTILFFVGNL
jgi:hemolysin III